MSLPYQETEKSPTINICQNAMAEMLELSAEYFQASMTKLCS
jgi:hypothetical protein